MIIYKDILQKLKDSGYNTNRIRKEKLLSETTLQHIRSGESITIASLDKICKLTGCRVEDLIEYREDDSQDNIPGGGITESTPGGR